MTYRDNMVELCMAGVGLVSPSQPYLDAVLDGETPERQRGLAGASSCALFWRSNCRRLGVVHPILAAPYRTGMAISDFVAINRDLGAFVEPGPETLIPGNAVLLSEHGEPHVLTIVDATVLPDGNVKATSVDGGQREGGLEAIERVERVFRLEGGLWWDYRGELRRMVSRVSDTERLFP